MKILLIDPNISLSSPSMRGVVLSLPALKKMGFEIEVWCWHCDDDLAIDKMVKLPTFGNVHTFGFYAFSIWSSLRMWWHFRIQKLKRPDVVFSVAWYQAFCDIFLVQFSPFDWERRQQRLGMNSLRDVFERIVNLCSWWTARRFLHRTTAKRVLCVSEAVRTDLQAVNPKLDYRLLVNCYDSARFRQELRELKRDEKRAQLGFSERDVVFVFASAGHYRRKGFPLVIGALGLLRKTFPEARLLVVGGHEIRLESLQTWLGKECPDWQEWITFTGMVSDVENYFAASDAFLFPSYSEAFALVEVEAAACGLPLFLTRHHGSEMILEDGVNGRFLEFNIEAIASVLAEFVRGDWKPASETHLKHAINSDEYARRFIQELIQTSALTGRL